MHGPSGGSLDLLHHFRTTSNAISESNSKIINSAIFAAITLVVYLILVLPVQRPEGASVDLLPHAGENGTIHLLFYYISFMHSFLLSKRKEYTDNFYLISYILRNVPVHGSGGGSVDLLHHVSEDALVVSLRLRTLLSRREVVPNGRYILISILDI